MGSLRLLIALVCLTVLAAEDGAIDWSTDGNRLTIGDPVSLTLRYRWHHEATVVRATPPHALMADEILSELGPERRYRDGDQEVREWTMQAVARRSGSWILPTPVLVLRRGDGPETTITAETLVIAVDLTTVPAHLPPASPLYMVPPAATIAAIWYWWVGATTLVLAVIMLVVVRRWQRPEVAIPPYERFLLDLDQLARAEEGKGAAAQLSAAARRYCGTCFTFDGVGSTTGEMDRLLRGQIPDGKRLSGRRLLDRLDALRWAPVTLRRSQVDPMREQVRDWIKELDDWQEAQRHAAEATREEATA